MERSTSEQARKLVRLGRDAVLQGLPLPTNEPPWIGAALLMLQKLRAPSSPSGASDAATIALDLLEATMARRTTRQVIECTRGCSFCCHSVVSTTAPEIFRLARWLQQNASARPPHLTLDMILQRADHRKELTLDNLMQQRPECVLLLNGACTAYQVRPGNCRRLLSLSKAACKADFEGVPSRIPVVEEAMQKGTHVRALMLAAVAAAKLPTTSYELSQALALVLREPDTERRWLNGEDVFSSLQIAHDPGPLQSTINHWLTRLQRFI